MSKHIDLKIEELHIYIGTATFSHVNVSANQTILIMIIPLKYCNVSIYCRLIINKFCLYFGFKNSYHKNDFTIFLATLPGMVNYKDNDYLTHMRDKENSDEGIKVSQMFILSLLDGHTPN